MLMQRYKLCVYDHQLGK